MKTSIAPSANHLVWIASSQAETAGMAKSIIEKEGISLISQEEAESMDHVATDSDTVNASEVFYIEISQYEDEDGHAHYILETESL